MYNMDIDIVFFLEVCHEFVAQMCCPCVMDEMPTDEMSKDEILADDMEQGTVHDDDDECGCSLCHLCLLIRTGINRIYPYNYKKLYGRKLA